MLYIVIPVKNFTQDKNSGREHLQNIKFHQNLYAINFIILGCDIINCSECKSFDKEEIKIDCNKYSQVCTKQRIAEELFNFTYAAKSINVFYAVNQHSVKGFADDLWVIKYQK